MINLKEIKKYILVLPTNKDRLNNANYIKSNIFNDLEIKYVINSEFDKFAYENIINTLPDIQTTIWEDLLPHYRKIQEYSCALETYRIIKEAYLLGYDNILYLEDDAKIENLNLIQEFLNHAPQNFDLLKLGYWNGNVKTFQYEDYGIKLYKEKNIYWIPSNDMPRYCNLANIYSRTGMEKYIKFQDKNLALGDLWTYIINDDKKYISTISLVNQINTVSSIQYT